MENEAAHTDAASARLFDLTMRGHKDHKTCIDVIEKVHALFAPSNAEQTSYRKADAHYDEADQRDASQHTNWIWR